MTMQCCECLKPRVIYTQHKLRMQDELCLRLLADVLYSFGSDLTAEGSSPVYKDLLGHVFARANLTCADKVESSYYSSEVFEDVCIHCGNPDNIVKGKKVTGTQPTCDFRLNG